VNKEVQEKLIAMGWNPTPKKEELREDTYIVAQEYVYKISESFNPFSPSVRSISEEQTSEEVVDEEDDEYEPEEEDEDEEDEEEEGVVVEEHEDAVKLEDNNAELDDFCFRTFNKKIVKYFLGTARKKEVNSESNNTYTPSVRRQNPMRRARSRGT
jgi:hypothetical protein